MVKADPEWNNCSSNRQSGKSRSQIQNSQLSKAQGRQGGLNVGPGKQPVRLYFSCNSSCGRTDQKKKKLIQIWDQQNIEVLDQINKGMQKWVTICE